MKHHLKSGSRFNFRFLSLKCLVRPPCSSLLSFLLFVFDLNRHISIFASVRGSGLGSLGECDVKGPRDWGVVVNVVS
jgi:hypothetical protein